MKRLTRSVSVLLLACFVASASEATAQELTAPLFNHIELQPLDNAPVRQLVLRNEVISFTASEEGSIARLEPTNGSQDVGVLIAGMLKKDPQQRKRIVTFVVVSALAIVAAVVIMRVSGY